MGGLCFTAAVRRGDVRDRPLEGVGVAEVGDVILLTLCHSDGTMLLAELDDDALDQLGHLLADAVQRSNAAHSPGTMQ